MLFYINQKIIKRLKEDIPFRIGVANALGVGERTIYDRMKKYEKLPYPNSTLTKAAAVKYFEEQGYEESEILTEEIPAD